MMEGLQQLGWVVMAVALGLLLCLEVKRGRVGAQLISPCPQALIVFGDSLSDTGNLGAAFPQLRPRSPYGQTYFGHPADRQSDGRLIVDFLAQGMHLPLLSPYLRGVGSDFQHGVNFAVGGSTATNLSIINPFYLAAQYDWFLEFKDNIVAAQTTSPGSGNSGRTPSLDTIADGLYVIESGGNDYNYAYLALGMARQAIHDDLVPSVVRAISGVAINLLEGGVQHLMIFNIPPQGCSAVILTTYPGFRFEYDQYGCHTAYNAIAQAHNTQLKDAVNALRGSYPDATILYADLYAFVTDIQRDPTSYGFQGHNLTHACCGVGGQYNYSPAVRCGQTGVIDGQQVHAEPCAHPNVYAQWDGVHFTDAFNHAAATAFLAGNFIDTPHTAGFPFACS